MSFPPTKILGKSQRSLRPSVVRHPSEQSPKESTDDTNLTTPGISWKGNSVELIRKPSSGPPHYRGIFKNH